MESKNSNNIKSIYKSFSEKAGFNFYPTDSLIARKDSNLLFNISGGVIYQDELLEFKESDKSKISSIQECVRTDGMKYVGYSGRHHLFFEMMGHFMFYELSEKETKEEFIKFAYDFLVKEIGLDKSRIFATVYPDDEITISIWKKLGNNNIIFSKENTFISPYADKSSLRTEIKWQKSDKENSLIELWNLVFTQFNSKNIFENPSKKIGADSGASLERIVTAYEDKCNNYENSMWNDYVDYISSLTLKGSIEEYRRVADFFNTSARLINEGIVPGNKVQPYMLRKILRTLFELCSILEINIDSIMQEYTKYNNLAIDYEYLYNIVNEEKKKYLLTIKNGLIQAKKNIAKKGVDNVDIEYIRSTTGLPNTYIDDLICELKKLKDNNVKICINSKR